jgi:hypothetical protein
MGKVHYIAMGGLHGYLPNFCCALEEYEDAVQTIVQIHELGRNRERQLREDSYIELNLKRDGNEYAEIVSCDCDTPEIHNDW